MRTTAALLCALALTPGAAFAQAWQVYSYPDAGFAVQLPAPPSIEAATFKAATGAFLPAKRYALRQDGIVYTIDVVDYSSVNVDDKAAIAWAETSLSAAGKVTVAIDARINRQFGRELSLIGVDGSRSTVALFFMNRRLYKLVGAALPPNALARSGDAIRFQQSLQFIGDDGGRGGGGGFAGFGAFGRLGGSGRDGRGGGFDPQARSACMGKTVGAAVQLDTPQGSAAATCLLIARPDRPPGQPGGAEPRGDNTPTQDQPTPR